MDSNSTTPWKRPEEVMRQHMMKKRRALAARMSRSNSVTDVQIERDTLSSSETGSKPPNHRK